MSQVLIWKRLKGYIFVSANKIGPHFTFMLYRALLYDEILQWHSGYRAGQEIVLRSYFRCLLVLNFTELWIRDVYIVDGVGEFWIMNLNNKSY